MENSKLTREMQDYKELLTRIQNLQSDFNTHLEFPSSLTPFLSHCEVILKWLKPAKSETILAHSFRDENLAFLLTPNKYLLVLNESVIVKHRGANNNWIMDQMKTIRSVKNISRKNHRLIPVKIVPSDEKEDLTVGIAEENTPLKKNDPDYVQQQFQECRRHIFKENASCIRRVSKHVNLGLDNINRNMSYTTHYNPYESYNRT
ncbi:hypothetical protein JTB14_013930 [Gonioctena quinquepunctata]|nr:hypothetical protein JTB14_013930 [Gonioctena quinquepunctata]